MITVATTTAHRGLPAAIIAAALVACRGTAGAQSSWADVTTPELAGVDHENHRGAAWGDYDGDGHVDLYVSHWGVVSSPFQGSPNQLFRNRGDGTFVEVTGSPIDVPGGLSHHPVWGDVDNNGRLDLYVTQSSNFGQDVSRLFLQDSVFGFTDITGGDPLALVGTLPRNATWVDFDLDGLLDLYVVISGGANLANRMLRNEGDGTFSLVITGAEDDLRESRSAAWGDFNNDGYQDVFVASGSEQGGVGLYRKNSLYRNMGDGTFVNVAAAAGVDDTGHGRGARWGDYNNDGYLDLIVANHVGGGSSLLPGNNLLYRNNGDETFTDVTLAAGVYEETSSRCVSFADYDNDGWLDLYVVNFGSGAPPNRLYRNDADGTFTEVGEGSPIEAPDNDSAAAWADFDNDGWLDLYTVGGSYSAPGVGQNRLLRNENHNGNNWIEVELTGTVSNRLGIGARLTVKAAGQMDQIREVQSGSGYNAQHAHRVHFGIGSATSVASLRVLWPSGEIQTFVNLDANQVFVAEEPCSPGNDCPDCNGNGTPDILDISHGLSDDCDANGVPDECEADCNSNGVSDACDLTDGISFDVNDDGVPDECQDCNANGIPDEFDIDSGVSRDCNENLLPDECDIAGGGSTDDNSDFIPDDCQDCDGNGVADDLDLLNGTAVDCDANGSLDRCDIASGEAEDCDENGFIDVCEIASDPRLDGDGSGTLDFCDFLGDVNFDGVVNIDDVIVIILNWGTCVEGLPCVDQNLDGVVDIDDLVIVILEFD